jgi:hypothetical protein
MLQIQYERVHVPFVVGTVGSGRMVCENALFVPQAKD